MHLPRRRFLQLAAALPVAPAMPRIAQAQAYPSKPVRIVAGFSSGSAMDTIARVMGQWLTERLGQSFVVENRGGAGGNLGTEAVVRSAPDGYTLLICGSPDAINATLYDKLSFNFLRDTTPVAAISRGPNVLVVHPSFPAKTVPGIHRLHQGQSRQGRLRVGRRRQRVPHGRRALHGDDRDEAGACAVSRPRARGDRSARRTGEDDLRHHAARDREHQGRQAARTGGDLSDAVRCIAGPADRRRFPAGL